MATSGAMNTSNDRIKYTITIDEHSHSIPYNHTCVTVSVRFYRTNTGYESYGTGTVYCKIDGVEYSAPVTSSQKITNAGIVLFSKMLNIDHNADGTKILTCSAWIKHEVVTSSEQAYSQTLTTIPRYAKITTFTVDKVNETSLKVTWDCDVSCDRIYYSLSGGAFVQASGYPSFNITGLSANTNYSVKIRVRRTDSQLTTDSSTLYQSTYDYPHCNSSPDFTIGDKLTLGFYNPLSRTIKVSLVLADGKEYGGDTISGTSLAGYNGDGWKNWLYGSIPNSQSAAYQVKVTYGSIAKTRKNGNTYKIKGNEVPTINGITYEDIDSKVYGITGNPQHIVQNQSSLRVNYDEATPNFSAGKISKYLFELNGVSKEKSSAGYVDFGKVNSSQDLTLTVTVTDSRGLTAKKTLKITMLEHSEPNATVFLERLNNYEDETYLTVDASVSSINGKNTMIVDYRYKLATDEYSPFVTIPNRQEQTLSLDKNSIFVFNVRVTDAFGAKFDREYILYKGVFPLFIDTEKNAVGINEFPAEGEALRVAGGVANFLDGMKIAHEDVADFIVEQGVNGAWTYRKWNSGNVDMECMAYRESSQANTLIELSLSLPFAVSKVKPYVTCLASGWAISRPPYFNVYGGNNSSDNCDELKLYYQADNATARTYYFAVQVKGTWR